MASYFGEPSRTFSEYLLIPGYSSTQCIPSQVSLKTPLVKCKKGTEPDISINILMVSAIMQFVSDDGMAVALIQEGGISFMYGSQAVEKQAGIIHRVKWYRAGFVVSDSNVSPDMTLTDVLAITEKTGHFTIAVTANGQPNGKLLGIVTNEDCHVSRMEPDTKVEGFMTTLDNSAYADESATLKGTNDIIWGHKINCLPLVNKNQELMYLVFRKDYDTHKKNENGLIDSSERYMVGAGINTKDCKQRVPVLLDTRADMLYINSSGGSPEWQRITIDYIRKNFGDLVKVGAGDVVGGDGLRFLVEAGADLIKVGVGGGAVCITRGQKEIGRGQTTTLVEMAKARDEYHKEADVHVPICSDDGIVHDYHIALALVIGADFVMLGRYFARLDESPTKRVNVSGSYMRKYWGEGSTRTRSWQRYDMGGGKKPSFEEGVDSFVPYAGSFKDNTNLTLSEVHSIMCNYGALTTLELQRKAKITLVSSTSTMGGGAHDAMLRDKRQRTEDERQRLKNREQKIKNES